MDLALAAVTDSYEEVKKNILQALHNFRRSYNPRWEFSEMESMANEFFMEAYHKFKPDRGKSFASWVYYYVQHNLLERLRRQAMQNARHKKVILDFDQTSKEARFDLDVFLQDLSHDGITMVRLILDSPLPIRHTLLEKRSCGKQRAYYAALTEHLGEQGWSEEYIAEVFQEVKQALLGS